MYYELYRGGSDQPTSSRASSASSPAATLSPEHPTLVLLSPSWLDVSMLEFSSLRSQYNCVLFDLRSHGRTKGEVNPAYDHFMGAADIGESSYKVAALMQSANLTSITAFAMVSSGAQPREGGSLVSSCS